MDSKGEERGKRQAFHELTGPTVLEPHADAESGTSIISVENGSTKLEATIDEKALLRKIDMRVIPILFLLYLAAFLDRVNIGNALTLHMPQDLHLKGNESNIALTIFFVPYVLFEIPSNILLKKLGPHIWLSVSIVTFGIVMLCQGFVQSYRGLLATRFFLGLAGTGVFPSSKSFFHHYTPRTVSCIWQCATLPFFCSHRPTLLIKTISDQSNRLLLNPLLVHTPRIPATLYSLLVFRHNS